MKFKLIYENHGNFGLHVGDYFLYLKYALESLGHTADIEYAFCPGHMNIMLECFNDAFTEKVKSSWISGTSVIVVATEFLTGQTFNNIYQDDSNAPMKSDHNQRLDFWQMRYKNFVKLMPRFSAIWHVADDQAQIYQAAFPQVSVQYMPHGYSDRFHTVVHRPDDEKDIDVLFTGTMTTYRKKVLSMLSDAGLVVVSSILFTAPFHRNDLISRSKLVLNIKQHPNWQHESVTRLYYHISNDSLLITDQCQYPTDLHDYVVQMEGSWLDCVKKQVALGNYNERAQAVRKRFAKERPVDQLYQKLLDQSGIASI